MKDKSSLSLGDIQSVLTNYVEAMRAALFDGKSVNIRDFGVFSLSAHTLGANHERRVYGEEYQIYTDQLPPFQQRFRPNLTSTRAGDKIEFLDLEAPKRRKATDQERTTTPVAVETKAAGGDEEAPDPTV